MKELLNNPNKVLIVTTKSGKLTGRGSDRKRRGADRIAALINIGIDYGELVRECVDKATITVDGEREINPEFVAKVYAKVLADGVTYGKTSEVPTEADVLEAVTQTVEGFDRTLDPSSERKGENPYEPLFVDTPEGGVFVKGAKVYNSTTGTGNVGDIHLYGLIDNYKVLVADEPIPTSVPRTGVTAVKKIVRRLLPIGGWVQYRLKAGTEFTLEVNDAETKFNALT